MNSFKKTLLSSAITGVALSNISEAAVVSFWDFNDGFSVPDETLQIVHSASTGNGTIYQQRADTDGNGKGGVAYSGNGISVIDGRAMAWDDVGKSGDNDAEFFISFVTTGFKDINIRMDLRGNEDLLNDGSAGIESYDLKYSISSLIDIDYNGGIANIKDFAASSSTTFSNNTAVGNPDTYTEISVDLSSVTDINNQSIVTIRFDDWKDNEDLRIDNILITGTVIPEPSSATFLGLGILGFLFRRKK